eukprot:1387418-Prorocentrum_lima.AAC.1
MAATSCSTPSGLLGQVLSHSPVGSPSTQPTAAILEDGDDDAPLVPAMPSCSSHPRSFGPSGSS